MKSRSLGLEEEDRAVAEVEVDEVFGLMRDEGAEISSHDAVPGWAFSLVKLWLCQILYIEWGIG